MSTPQGYRSQSTDPVTGWIGWVVFAAVFIVMIGTLTAIQGLSAIFRDEAFWVSRGGEVLMFDLTSWGWIHLVLGLIMIAVGILLMRGSTFARVVAIGLVAINLVTQFTWAPVYPFWSMIMIAIDILVIYALVVHGGELRE